jgi:uncharacterized protein
MKCPTCPDAILLLSDRQGVEIDYCPTCRGVWLDRGELDKLMAIGAAQPAARQAATPGADFVDSDFQERQAQQRGHGYAPRRKKSWLNDIFD